MDDQGYQQHPPDQPDQPQEPDDELRQGRRRSRLALVTGLVLGAVALAGCGVSAHRVVGNGGDNGGPGSSTAGKYTIKAPATLPGGYTRTGNAKSSPSRDEPGYASYDGGLFASFSRGATPEELNTPDSAPPDSITVDGSWGTITNPGALMNTMRLTTRAMVPAGTTWKAPLADADAKDATDPGSKLVCGVASADAVDFPMCLWVNHSTTGSVMFPRIPSTAGGAAGLSPDGLADRARAVRDAMVVSK